LYSKHPLFVQVTIIIIKTGTSTSIKTMTETTYSAPTNDGDHHNAHYDGPPPSSTEAMPFHHRLDGNSLMVSNQPLHHITWW